MQYFKKTYLFLRQFMLTYNNKIILHNDKEVDYEDMEEKTL